MMLNRIVRSLTGRAMTLKWLFLGSLVPSTLAISVLVFQYFQTEREGFQQELLKTARALTLAVDRELASTEVALQTLATSQALARGDLAAFYRRSQALLEVYPADNIVLTDLQGRQLVNLKRPFGDPLPAIANPDLVRHVVSTRKPAISGLFRGNVMQRQVVAYGIPVFQDGQMAYVLVMARFPERIGKILSDQNFPNGWIAGIFDAENTIVARTLNPERLIGQKISPVTARALSESNEGPLEVVIDEGIPVVGAYSRSTLSGWTVAVAIPTKALYWRLCQAAAPLVICMVVLLGIGLGLAWLFGRYITASLRQLGTNIQRMIDGQRTLPMPTDGPCEFVALESEFTRMLQERNDAEHAFRESELFYHSLFQNMLNGFAYCRLVTENGTPVDGLFLAVNPAFEQLTGLRDVAGRKASEVMPGIWDSDPELLRVYSRVVQSGTPESLETYVKALGHWISIAVYSPQPEHFVTVFDVITERKEQQGKIARLVRIHAVLSGINSTIVRIHEQHALLDAVCQVAVEKGQFGMAWIGMLSPDSESLHPVAGCGIECESLPDIPVSVGAEIPNGQGTAYEALSLKRAVYCNDLSAVPVLGPVRALARRHGYLSVCALPLIVDGRGIGVMGLYAREAGFFDADEMRLLDELAADISFALQYIEREKQLDYLAYYDALTGLPNRSLFLDRLDLFMQGAKTGNQKVAAVVIDLDRFTQINEAYGRDVGDELLKQVAARLQGIVGKPQTVARIASDLFAVAVGYLSTGAEPVQVMQAQVLEAFSQLFVVKDAQLYLTAHVGIALYPDDADDAVSLFQNAEAALSEAQASGIRCLYYSREINARMAASLGLEQEMRTALAAGQFVMHYQPRVDLRSGQIIGAEALIRWMHPERGMIPPTDFIPIAEQTGFIVSIGAWVIDSVCAQQAAWLTAGLDIVPVAINLSPVQFAHGNLQQTLDDALAKHELEVKYLELELTESSVMRDPEQAALTMKGFRKCGLRLSLDDFGTGYSSLAYLRRFSFDFVKIDRAFVSDITQNPADAAIATAVIAMAHSLNLQVVAEGVETEGQLRFLRRHQCDQIQGFHFSPPVPSSDFADMLRCAKCLNLDEAKDDIETRTVLIVDDEPGIQAALYRVLRREGYRVLKANSGQEGLELLATNSVQVIVSDQRMPNMSGSEFLSIVKELYPDTMRIVLSGYTDLQVVTEAVNRGAVYKFLTKPWEDDLLKEHIRDAFMRYRPRAGEQGDKNAIAETAVET